MLLTFLLLNVLAFVAIGAGGDVNALPGNQAYPSADIGPDGTIYVVYQDDRGGDYDLYLAKSTDGGTTFNDPAEHILVYNDGAATTFQGQPAIDVDPSGTIHIAFVAAMAYILYYTYSTDGGLTFSPLKMVSDAPVGTQNVAQYPSIRVDEVSGHIYIAWRDQRTGVPKACYSVGTPVEEVIVFSENRYVHGDPASSVRQSSPSFAIEGSGTVYATWHEDSEGDLNVYYAKSTDFGESFDFCGRVDDAQSFPGTDQGSPSASIDSMGRLYVAYFDGRAGSRNEAIAFAYRDVDGEFTGHQILTSSTGCSFPKLRLLDGGLLFIMYTEEIEIGQDSYRGMFYTSSLDSGMTWSNANQVDPKSPGINNYNQLILPQESGKVLLVWECNDDGDIDVVSEIIQETFPARMSVALEPAQACAIPGQAVSFEAQVTLGGQLVNSDSVQFYSDSGGIFSSMTSPGTGIYQVDFTVPEMPIPSKIGIHCTVTKQNYPPAGDFARVIVRENLAPVPVISGSESGETGQNMQYSAAGSYDPDGIIVLYEWDFGDGSNATGETIVHSWPNAGNYTVLLRVHDDMGAFSDAEMQVSIADPVPALMLSITMNKSYIEAGGTAQVTVFVTFAGAPVEGAQIMSYCEGEKQLSHPVTVTPSSVLSNSNGRAYLILEAEPIAHSYPETLCVSATMNGYSDANGQLRFWVYVRPVAEFTWAADYTNASFDASSSYDLDGYIVTYQWDFGDGETGNGVQTIYNYSAGGWYDVLLTVTDNNGLMSSWGESILVVDPFPPLEVEIIPSENPITNKETTTISVRVTAYGLPVSEATVVLQSSYRAMISPASALTDDLGIATFSFWSRCSSDQLLTLDATASKEGYTAGSGTLNIVLDYPDLYVDYVLESSAVLSGESVNVTIIVSDRKSVVELAKVSAFPEAGTASPSSGETDEYGIFTFAYIAQVAVDEPTEILILLDVAKYGYEVNNTVRVPIIVDPVPLLELDADISFAVAYWYEESSIDVTVTSDGLPVEGILIQGQVMSGIGSLLDTDLISDANGSATFVYTTPMVLREDFVIVVFTASEPGYISGTDYVLFKVRPPAIDLRIISCPETVAPGELLNIQIFAIDENGVNCSYLALSFRFESNISYELRTGRTDVDGYARTRSYAPNCDFPVELTFTVVSSVKGYIESINSTVILVDPELASASGFSPEDRIDQVSGTLVPLLYYAACCAVIAFIFSLVLLDRRQSAGLRRYGK